MSKICGKCQKSVYPMEELKCLDKVWHKGCFSCTTCNMTLNMKNYKGYNKNPYCSAHYPKTSFTAVADTPEMNRLAQNTKLQSQVKYHEEFEKHIKGTAVQVSDDPELRRIKQNTAIQSNVEYRGMREKAESAEQKRSSIDLPRRPQQMGSAVLPPDEYKSSPYSDRNQGHSVTYSSEGKRKESSSSRNVGSIHDYDPMNEKFGSLVHEAPMPARGQWEETVSVPAPGGYNGHPQQPQHYPPPSQPAMQGPVYNAMYDYEAQDDDEVSFAEGDLIVNVEEIDSGWMIGTVHKSGQRGMLPANYVERA